MDERTRSTFQSNIDVQANGCWHWIGGIHAASGYGRLHGDYVHRVSYRSFVGPIPEGLTIDHVCHNRDATCPGGSKCLHRRCVNPAHLEAVTGGENVRRAETWLHGAAFQRGKTHCPNGHPYDGENLYVRPDGKRDCRSCGKERMRKVRARIPKAPKQPKPPKEFCKNGHSFAEVGRNKGNACKECARQALRRSRERAKAVLPPKEPDTHCRHGHEWTEENTYVSPKGLKACRACHRDKSREWHRTRTAERRAPAA